jgi:hypothetical protein
MQTKWILTFFVLLFVTTQVYSQLPFDVKDLNSNYVVGKDMWVIAWDDSAQVFKIYNKQEQICCTILLYKEELPGGGFVFDEYELDGKTYVGTLTFEKNFWKGEYVNSTGEKFKVEKRRKMYK